MIPRRRAYLYPGARTDITAWSHIRPEDAATIIEAWEREVARFTGMPYAAAVSSGRDGLRAIVEHVGVRAGDEVIIPSYTLKDLIPLIEQKGARAVPADIDPETMNVTPGTVEERITPHTKAILVLHAFGSPCRVKEIARLAEERGIPLIEDCAHSLGATVEGRETGSFGYASFFSFETTKPVNTFGGGIVVSHDRALIEAIQRDRDSLPWDARLFRKKMQATRVEEALFSTGLCFPLLYALADPRWKRVTGRLYRVMQHAPPAGIRYLPVQAELGLAQIRTLKERIGIRRERAGLLKGLLNPRIRTQRIEDGCESTWYFFVGILPREAPGIRRALLFRGIDAGIEDEIADNCARILRVHDCPHVQDLYGRAINLPLYERISEGEIRKIARAVDSVI
jgi:perosamine synthetase